MRMNVHSHERPGSSSDIGFHFQNRDIANAMPPGRCTFSGCRARPFPFFRLPRNEGMERREAPGTMPSVPCGPSGPPRACARHAHPSNVGVRRLPALHHGCRGRGHVLPARRLKRSCREARPVQLSGGLGTSSGRQSRPKDHGSPRQSITAMPLISINASGRTRPFTTTPVAAGHGGPFSSSRRT